MMIGAASIFGIMSKICSRHKAATTPIAPTTSFGLALDGEFFENAKRIHLEKQHGIMDTHVFTTFPLVRVPLCIHQMLPCFVQVGIDLSIFQRDYRTISSLEGRLATHTPGVAVTDKSRHNLDDCGNGQHWRLQPTYLDRCSLEANRCYIVGS